MSVELIECPSGLKLAVRNMKAKEMALLAQDDDEDDKKKARKHRPKRQNPVTGILTGCTLEVYDIGPYEAYGALPGVLPHIEAGVHVPGPGKLPWPELLLCDRFFTLLRVRAATWGDGYEFRARCKDKTCAAFLKPFLWEIPLSELAVQKLPEASRVKVKAKDLYFDFTLGGKGAKFKLQQGLDEMSGPDLTDLPKSKLFLAQCAARLTYLEGVDVTDWDNLLEWVGELDMAEVVKATSLYNDVDGGVETNTIAECPRCGLEFDVAVPFDAISFLLPDKKTPALKRMAEPTT